MLEIDENTTQLNLTINYNHIKPWLFEYQSTLQNNKDKSIELKKLFLEVNHYLFFTTFVVTMLYYLLRFLQYREDIYYWQNKKNLKGISLKTLWLNFIQNFIIFIYLLDQAKLTSKFVWGQILINLSLQLWKISKMTHFEKFDFFPYFSIKSDKSYIET